MESHSSIVLVVLTLVVSLPTASLVSASCDFPAIFNFGDSNSDTGGLSAIFGQALSPAGETFFHHPAGRYCDGRLVIDFIAKSLRLPYISAYLDSVGSNFTHGANFATAASTVRRPNTTLQLGGVSPISLNVQYDEFYDFLPRSQVARSRGGVFAQLMPKAEAFSRGLYTFDIGQNDLTEGLSKNMTVAQVKTLVVPDVLDQFKNIIKDVHSQGGRNFWIHNTGPVGCLPYMLVIMPVLPSEIDRHGCATPYNELCEFFNRELKHAVVQLRKELHSAAITYVDVYKAKINLIRQPQKHGIKEPIRACCGYGGGKYNFDIDIRCGGKIKVHGKEVLVGKSCKDPSVCVNWDGVHYTEASNKKIFDQIVDGSLSDPPIPLHMACHKHL